MPPYELENLNLCLGNIEAKIKIKISTDLKQPNLTTKIIILWNKLAS